MNLTELLKALNEQAGAIATITAALVAVVTAVYRVKTHLSRSRLIKSDAFPLPEVPGEQAIFAKDFPQLNTLLVGRDTAVREVSTKIKCSVLTFIYGESGSGKSTFLKLGICRDLKESWVPIYVDVWGTDWVSGPWKSLADATDYALRSLGIGCDGHTAVTVDSVFQQLRTLRAKTGRRPLLILDQVDDYQNAHRARFRDPATQFFLSPDELCITNPFWKELRDLLVDRSEPVHVVLATREDAQDGLHSFGFTQPRVYRLPRLDPLDAVTLIQRLSPEGVIKNPDNGFTDLTKQIVSELGRDGQGAILPMQLRVALAGLGRLGGPLTPGRLDKLGGISALGAIYLDSVLRTSPEAWPILNVMAERTPIGGAKAITLPRKELLTLIQPSAQNDQLLQHLAAARILRQRLAGSPEEVWQLYHDYLADAIVALDRLKRKWHLLLSVAAERFRSSDGLKEKWMHLLSPALQLRLLWRRIKDRDFRYGAYSGFARLSLIRMAVNPLILSLVVGGCGWGFWQETYEAREIVDTFHQGDGHEKEEYDALWRLAKSHSSRTIRAVFVDFLATQDSAAKFNEHYEAIQTSVGLRVSALDALRSVSVTGPCATPSGAYIKACYTLTRLTGEQERFANSIVEQLGKATGAEATDLGNALAALAPEIKGDQAERGANIIAELLGKTKGSEAANLDSALAALAPQVKGDQAERLANIIAELLGKSTGFEAANLGSALAALAPQVKGDQAERGANRIAELLGKSTGFEAANLGSALAALAPQVKGDQAERGANRIAELLRQTTSSEAGSLGDALAALAPQVKGDQVERAANRIAELLGTTSDDEDDSLGSALAALTAQAKGDKAVVRNLLAKFIEQKRAMPCDEAVRNMEERQILVDMLKWPVCTGRDGIMLRIAELQGARPAEFGEFKEPGKRSTFHADLRRFIVWLKKQRDSNGKPFDVDGPPAWSPGNLKEGLLATSEKP